MSIQGIQEPKTVGEIQNHTQNVFIPLDSQTRLERLTELQDKRNAVVQENLKRTAALILILFGLFITYKLSAAVLPQKNEQENHSQLSSVTPIVRKEPISILFAGDVMLDGRSGKLVEQKGEKYIFAGVQDLLDSSDISMINLENPISSGGVKYPGKQYNFRANLNTVSALTAAGIDVVSLANNHVLDYGVDALKETIDILEKNKIKYVGAGIDRERAASPIYYNIEDTKIAIIASSRVIPTVDWAAGANKPGVFRGYFIDELKPEIVKAKENADIVFVYMHWGEEGKEKPEDYQKQLAYGLIDAGADAVIGAHPHVVQGFEMYKGKVIAYSLGNFIFDSSNRDTFMLNIQLKDKSISKINITPCQVINYIPFIMNDTAKKKSFINRINSISFNTRIDDFGNVEKN